ncbi:MAG: Na+/H+ antiporter NhaA [Nitriliruptorales bacterium]|nr:Na+/H+ antiporter NhaA [Nitriliruptorales bacterium]
MAQQTTPGFKRPRKQQRVVTSVIVQPLQAFMHTEVAGGVFLLIAAAVALVWANSPAHESYERLWETPLSVTWGPFAIEEALRDWVNDLLMAFFFFVVGLEIKRELVLGELRDVRAATLPLVCALGGMIAPASLYALLNTSGPATSGWGVPMATDIAFAVGVLALVGARAPASLKVFLLTLAVADDLGAIAVIAIFYTRGLQVEWLAVAAAAVLVVLTLRRSGIRRYVWYVGVAGVLWLAIFESGVHATIAGVILGFLTPARPLHPPEAVSGLAERHLERLQMAAPDGVADEREQATLMEVSRLAREGVSPLARLEHALHSWTSFLILPLFALANAGVRVAAGGFTSLLDEPVTIGIILGLVVGKPLGITIAAFITVKTGLGRLPRGVGWLEIVGVGLLGGVGFTVAIFIAGLAFEDTALTNAAKVGILLASATAGIVGAAFLAARDAAKHS